MRAYVRLVELGTFTAVAEELRVEQSTVSKWIAALEDEVGVQLIERTTRSQQVTEAGRLFYRRATDILGAYDEAIGSLRERDPEPRGRIRVGVPVVFGRRHIVPHIARFMRRFHGIEIELVFSDRYANLVDERLDVAIRVGIPVDSAFRGLKLGEARRHLVASPGYVARSAPLTDPRDLTEHQCLTHTALGAGDVWKFRRGTRQARARVRGRFAANNSEALLAMARSGLGIALLASWLVDPDLRRKRLVSLLPGWELPPAPTYALTPPGRHMHPRVRALLDFLAEAHREELAA